VIDLHCHILPGMDDGPSTIADSLEMCRTAAGDGIRTIVATPHYNPGCFTWSADIQQSALHTLQQKVDAAEIPVKLLSGAEIAFCTELPELFKNAPHLAINRGCYFLLEFGPQAVPANIELFLSSIITVGYLPIIAHPERNSWFIRHHDVLTSLVRCGVLLQITADSLLGEYGTEVQRFCQQLLRNNLVQIIASDAHNTSDRPALLSAAVKAAAEQIGDQNAAALVTTNPLAILNGIRLTIPETAGYLGSEATARPESWLRRMLGYLS